MQTNADKALECRQNADKQKGKTWKILKAKWEFTWRVSDDEWGWSCRFVNSHVYTLWNI